MRYWKRVNAKGKTTMVESYSHNLIIPDAIEITEAEFNAYLASLPEFIPAPVRNLAAEIDDLKAQVAALQTKIAPV